MQLDPSGIINTQKDQANWDGFHSLKQMNPDSKEIKISVQRTIMKWFAIRMGGAIRL